MKLMIKLFALVLLVSATSSWAGSEKRFGIVDSYRIGENKIVINDQAHKFSDSAKVYNQKGNVVSKANLTVGTKLLYVSKKFIISRIDVLPASAKAEHYESDEE